MSKASISAAILFSVVASAGSVRSQDRPTLNYGRIQGILGAGLSPTWKPKSQLLEDPQVQKEIELKADQKERMKAVGKERDQVLAGHDEVRRKNTAQLRDQGDPQALEAFREEANAARISVLDGAEAALLR